MLRGNGGGKMHTDGERERRGLAWQIGVWDRIAPIYVREIDQRFVPVVDQVITRARLQPGQHVLDLGAGTGAVALRAAPAVAPDGRVVAVDLSAEMLELARVQAAQAGHTDIIFKQGRAEEIPAEDQAFDMVLASLIVMYIIDRAGHAARWPLCRRGLGGSGRE